MLKTKAGWGLLLVLGLVQPALAFNTDLVEEPYIELPSPKTLDGNAHKISIQHHFNDWNIESMTFRFGYGLTNALELDATAMYHSTEIDFDNSPSQVTAHEFEATALYGILSESRGNPLDLDVLLGVNRLFSTFTFQDHQTLDDQTRAAAGLVAGRTVFPWLAVQASPLGIYSQDDAKTVYGIEFGVKFMFEHAVALVGEAPILLNNPYGWQNPWSVGVQFHLGPHMWTLFAANTYAPTLPYQLQGLPLTYYGFRWAF